MSIFFCFWKMLLNDLPTAKIKYCGKESSTNDVSGWCKETLPSRFFYVMTETDPVSETLCLKKTKTMDNIHSNNHVHCHMPSSQIFGLILSSVDSGHGLSAGGCERALGFHKIRENSWFAGRLWGPFNKLFSWLRNKFRICACISRTFLTKIYHPKLVRLIPGIKNRSSEKKPLSYRRLSPWRRYCMLWNRQQGPLVADTIDYRSIRRSRKTLTSLTNYRKCC
jgi:hypothetical protein